jgi:type II secretory pathway component PulK
MSGGAAHRTGGGEDGFALVAALMAALLFALFAYAVLASDRGAVAGLDARLQQARMEAAAEAAVATIASDLGGGGAHWSLDGRSQSLDLDDMQVTAAVQDDRGLLPANGLKPAQLKRLLQSAGASKTLDPLVDNIEDWQDGGQRPKAATALDYAALGLRQRGNAIRTVDELAEIKGFTPDLLAKVAPDLTVFPDLTSAFDPKLASPRAQAVMSTAGSPTTGGGLTSTTTTATPTPVLDASNSNIGRPFTLTLDVDDGRGGRLHRVVIVELTGLPATPVWIRAFT